MGKFRVGGNFIVQERSETIPHGTVGGHARQQPRWQDSSRGIGLNTGSAVDQRVVRSSRMTRW